MNVQQQSPQRNELGTNHRLGQYIRDHLLSGQVLDLHLVGVDQLLHVEVAHSDVLGLAAGTGPLVGESDGGLVVLVDDRALTVVVVQFLQQLTQPYNLG